MAKQAIGGYFSLELPFRAEYHKNAFRLNTGRSCLEYILRARGYKKVYVPYYTCEAVMEPINKLGIFYEFYHIDIHFEIRDHFTLKADEALLYTNYFGLKQRYVEHLVEKIGARIIVDNTQAFYAKPIQGVDTFYTCRKFFGTADGAYLYTDKSLDEEFELDVSFNRMTHLLKRIDLSAEQGFVDFRKADDGLDNQPIRKMSRLTQRIIQSIDYEVAANKRIHNFHVLAKTLRDSNRFKWDVDNDMVPLIYPYYIEDGARLREYLIDHQVFCARYWPNVLKWCNPEEWEYKLTENLVCIPIDQRYSEEDMKQILYLISLSSLS